MFELLTGEFELPKRKGNKNLRKNRKGFRYCIKCKFEFLLCDNNFHKEKSRPSGYSYTCKTCQSEISKLKPKRPDRWRNLTPEKRAAKSINQMKYYNSLDKAIHRINSYRAMDKKKGYLFDLTVDWYKENIEDKPCHYCGVIGEIGCDRIDNKQGHTKLNVVPCCKLCNITRMDNFTYDEMILLGNTIRSIRHHRKLFEAGKPLI